MGNLILCFAFVALSTLPAALATPLKQSAIAPNTATCDVSLCSQGHGSAQTCYKIHIGRPYINGAGCPSIQQSLIDEIKYLGNYHCDDNGAGQTSLSFSTAANVATNIKAINALQESYPDVPFQAERICLMEGNEVPADWPPVEVSGEKQARDLLGDGSSTLDEYRCKAIPLSCAAANGPVDPPSPSEPRVDMH